MKIENWFCLELTILELILLYKSFEIGISNKAIIKKNLSILIFSVSKAQKDFRYDVLDEIKKKKIL